MHGAKVLTCASFDLIRKCRHNGTSFCCESKLNHFDDAKKIETIYHISREELEIVDAL